MKLSKGQRLFILGFILVVLDQIIKVLVKTNMDLGETIDVIGDWFKLHFVLNKGMAFGMAFGGVWVRSSSLCSESSFLALFSGGSESFRVALILRQAY